MTTRSGPRHPGRDRKALFCSVVVLSWMFLGCDKAPEPPAERPEKSPHGEAAPASAPTEEPHTEEAGDAPPGDVRAAVDPGVKPPQFDEASSPEFRQAFEKFSTWVKDNGGRVHAAFVDLESKRWLLRSGADTPVNPASNAKILTAAAALELLGPGHRFSTELFGDIDRTGRAPRLVLVGGGDPDFSTADLWRLLRVAEGEGLTKVGDVVVDQSLFSDAYVPPAFDQQPKEWAPFRAPISALSLNRNAIDLNVVTTRAGEAARVWYDPPGVVDEQGRVTTSPSGKGDQVTWTIDPGPNAQHPRSIVGGALAEGLGRRRYARRMEDPRLAGGLAFSALLRDGDVEVEGKVLLGKVGKEKRIGVWHSEPVAELVRALGKDSDNFVAEMLFVALSAADGDGKKPWTSGRGAQVVKKWLESKKIELGGMRIENGSGLFDANHVSAELLAKVLAAVEENPRIYQDFVSHLAMGATDGTMQGRMTKDDLGQRVRAKTGTLEKVNALSGYVQRVGGRPPGAFSIIVVDAKASHAAVRGKIDDLVLTWAKLLG